MVFVIHWHESAMDIHVFPIPIPIPTSRSTRSLWVFPVHQVRTFVPCIQPGLVICFTLDNIHVSVLFSWNIPPSPSPRVQNSVLYICVWYSLELHTDGYIFHFLLCLLLLFFYQLFGRPPQTTSLPSCISFLGDGFGLHLRYNVMNLCPQFFRYSVYQI